MNLLNVVEDAGAEIASARLVVSNSSILMVLCRGFHAVSLADKIDL